MHAFSTRYPLRLAVLAVLVFPLSLAAVNFPAASPASTIRQRIGLTDLEVVYSRPGVKERKIFGGLVAYGEVWRTGANAATKFTVSTPVKLNGTLVPAGSYALFTIPGEKEWTIIINKEAEQSGAFNYDAKEDLVRFTAKPVTLAAPVETFTIGFNDLRDESATMNLTWEKTRVPITVEIDLVDRLVPEIEAAMAADGGSKPYFQAAMFYYDHDLDLQKARKWIDAAVSQQDRYYIVHLQAKILARLGEKEAAIKAAQHSIELAEAAKDNGYVRLNRNLIARLRQ